MKVFFRTIHLYLALAAGLVIFCSCLTGTILVFEKEIDHTLHRERYYVKTGGNRLPLSQLVAAASKRMPKAKVASVMVYNDPERAVEIGVMPAGKKGKKDGDKPSSKTEKVAGGKEHGANEKKEKKPEKATTTIFVNPYTAQVTGQYSRKDSFLFSVEMFHRFLLAGKDSAGDMIVGISTLLFLFILVTGVILWWPKTKAIMRQRFKIKWDGSGKRLTHDLHVVTGFYTSLFLIITVLTGLIMSFKWANDALFIITGSKQVKEQPKAPLSAYSPGVKALTLDTALQRLAAYTNTAEYYNIRIPADTLGTYSINVLPKGAIESTADTYYIDQYSGKISGMLTFASKSLGQRARALVKPIHTGAIYGLPTKIISFIVCGLSLIFPVTGAMMWLSRIKKKKAKVVSVVAV